MQTCPDLGWLQAGVMGEELGKLGVIENIHWVLLFLVSGGAGLGVTLQGRRVARLQQSVAAGLFSYPWSPLPRERAIRKASHQRSEKLILTFEVISALSASLQILRGLSDGNRKEWDLIFKGWLPFRRDKVPNYYIGLVYQLLVAPSVWISMNAFFAQFVRCSEAVLCHLELLKHALAEAIQVSKDTQQPFDQVFRQSIIHHQTIIKYFKEFKYFAKPILVLFTIVVAAVLCTNGYVLTDPTSTPEMLVSFTILIAAEIQLPFAYSFLGQTLSDKSGSVKEALYQMDWARLEPPHRRLLIPMMMQAQRPFSIAGISAYNLENFMETMTTSYSYLNMLLMVRKNEAM